MAQVLQVQQVAVEWADLARWKQRKFPKSARKRSPGIHLSGVIDYCVVEAGLMTKKEIDEDEMPLRMAVGMAWESWIVGLYPDMIWQPGEWHKAGIYGTPDGLTYPDRIVTPAYEQGITEEFKATWYSMAKWRSILDAKRYIWQLCGNCYGMGTTLGRLHVLWVNGDYRKQRGPHYITYLIEFTQTEINQFWASVIVKNKKNAVPEKH